AEKATADRAAAERVAAEKAAAERTARERAAAEKAAADKAAAEKAATERAASELAAAKQQDEQNVGKVLEKYIQAFNSLDSVALSQIVSSSLAADLKESRSYRLDITGVRIRIDGDTATVTGTRRANATPKRGGESQRPVVGPVTLRMRRAGSSWIIEDVR